MRSRLNRSLATGFTLVEILIVVIILGILASIVIPQFQNTQSDAKKAALVDTLHALRVQIQLYTVQHGDKMPDLATSWNDLTTVTTYGGENKGPYLTFIPRNPLNNFETVKIVNTDVAFGSAVSEPNIGFVYNTSNGVIWGTNKAGDKIYNEGNSNDPANY